MAIKFATYSLGCRTNQVELEEIQKKLANLGFLPVQLNQSPEIIIFNTCVVTQKAEKETRNMIRQLKRKNPQAFLVVLGCAVTAHQKKLINLPQADLFLGNQEKDKLISVLKNKFLPFSSEKPKKVKSKYQEGGRAFIKIQEGCARQCSYCITTILRGKPKSKTAKEIIEKINQLPKNIKEVVLVGTAIDQWGIDLSPKKNLLFLLKEIIKKTKIPKITLSSLNPEGLNKNLAEFIISNSRFSSFFHLSLQSGSEKVLKDMGRKYQFNQLNKIIQLIKSKRPQFVLRADIIVGFPTETEEDFQKTVQLIKQLKIAFVHIFPFSHRPETLAFKKIKKGEWQDLPLEIKKKRAKIIQKETEKIRKEIAESLKNKILDCLLLTKANHYWEGLAENSFPVKIKGNNFNQGDLIKVKVIDFKDNFLWGKVLSS
ncbi:MAG: tRNA (N(6)-L-threonylcarbamoyladenosine(37)-C(2))-methylthiotransferase MtaB [Microgenomates group bacterium]